MYSSQFYDDLLKISSDTNGIQKYINVGDEDLIKKDLNSDYVQNMLNKYKPISNFDDQKKNEFYSWKNLLSLPVMPISLQYENIRNYIVQDVKFTVRFYFRTKLLNIFYKKFTFQ